VTEYTGPERRQDSVTNAQLAEQVTALQEQLAAVNDQLSDHRQQIESRYVTREDMAAMVSTMKRDMTAEMLSKTKTIFDDTINESFATYFKNTLAEHRRIEREERKQDIADAFRRGKLVVLYLLPFLTALNILSSWVGWP
jgi:uncharacterized membrane-anchored protein YhcB (DUF1043 family)